MPTPPQEIERSKAMSHTTKINRTNFIHNGDYSGEVIIGREMGQTEQLVVPFKDLKEFVAQYVTYKRVRRLENTTQTLDEILGL